MHEQREMKHITEPRIEKTDRVRTFATAGGFGAILLWSTTIAVARSLSEQLGPVTAAAAVYSVAGTVSLARLVGCDANRRQIRQLPRKYLIGCGTLFIAYMLFLYLAIGLATDRQQVLEIGLLNYLWPTLTLFRGASPQSGHPASFPGHCAIYLGRYSCPDARSGRVMAVIRPQCRNQPCSLFTGTRCRGSLGPVLRSGTQMGWRQHNRRRGNIPVRHGCRTALDLSWRA